MRVEQIYLAKGHRFKGRFGKEPLDQPMLPVPEAECVAGRGLRGDRYFDFKPDFKGQITFFERGVYERMCEQFGVCGKDPDVFRRNVIVSGIDLATLVDREFEVQGIRFHGSEEAAPCFWMNQAFAEGAEEALRGKGGLRARILSSGILHRETP